MSASVPAKFRRQLEAVDAASKDALTDFTATLEADANTLDHLLAGASHAKIQRTSTWALKALLEDGAELTREQRQMLWEQISAVDEDWSLLHLLQCVQFAGIEAGDSSAALLRKRRSRLEDLLQRDHKFVRAWTYDALAQLARVHPRMRSETLQLLRAALEDEAPSVRARVRHALRILDGK